jgi:ADP-ribose pyrophosphatase
VEPTIASRLIYRGRVMTVRVDEVLQASGRRARREIVEHPGAAAVVALTDDAHVIMVRQYRKAVERTLLEIPAGTLEPGEAPDACARRELVEECGLRADTMAPLITFIPSPGLLSEQITIYVARGLHLVPQPSIEEEEGLRSERVPLVRVQELIDAGEIHDAKTLIGLLLAARR